MGSKIGRSLVGVPAALQKTTARTLQKGPKKAKGKGKAAAPQTKDSIDARRTEQGVALRQTDRQTYKAAFSKAERKAVSDAGGKGSDAKINAKLAGKHLAKLNLKGPDDFKALEGLVMKQARGEPLSKGEQGKFEAFKALGNTKMQNALKEAGHAGTASALNGLKGKANNYGLACKQLKANEAGIKKLGAMDRAALGELKFGPPSAKAGDAGKAAKALTSWDCFDSASLAALQEHGPAELAGLMAQALEAKGQLADIQPSETIARGRFGNLVESTRADLQAAGGDPAKQKAALTKAFDGLTSADWTYVADPETAVGDTLASGLSTTTNCQGLANTFKALVKEAGYEGEVKVPQLQHFMTKPLSSEQFIDPKSRGNIAGGDDAEGSRYLYSDHYWCEMPDLGMSYDPTTKTAWDSSEGARHPGVECMASKDKSGAYTMVAEEGSDFSQQGLSFKGDRAPAGGDPKHPGFGQIWSPKPNPAAVGG